MKILVVDNDDLILEFMKDILEKEGHKVLTAKDGLSALDILKSYTPDVVFTDLVMPNIGGKKLCEIIRGKEKLKDARLIILSAIAAEEEADVVEIGANACIAKGRFDEMAQHVLDLIRQYDLGASQAVSAVSREVIGVRDVSARKTTEELLSVKRHFEVILERISEGILETTAEGRIVFANPIALSLIDMPEEELLASNFVDIFSEDDRHRVGELFHSMKGEPKAITDESPVNLAEHQVTLHIIPIEGEISSAIVILNDVTERKRSEEALKKAHDELEERVKERTLELVKVNDDLKLEIEERMRAVEALRESEEKYRSVLEANPHPVIVCDMEGKVIYISPAFTRIFAWTLDECLGKTMDFFVPKENWPETKMMIDKVKAGEGLSGVESRRFTKEGKIIDVSLSTAIYRDPEGNPVGSVVNFQDITEEKRLRKESEYRLQQVIQADKLASLGEMVAGVAHEINNPNSFITYNLPLLEETWQIIEPILSEYSAAHPGWKRNGIGFAELCEDMKGIIRDIKTGSDRIRTVVTNLKDFARLDESTHAKAVKINEVIEKALAIVGAQIKRSVEKIEINLADTLPEIMGHPQKLEQVVANLVVNAAHAIPDKEEGRIAVTSRYVEPLHCVLIEIEDNGIGMAHEVQQRIFEPFFTTRRDVGGTGLGLSVSYGLIKDHKGIIGVLSRPGLGSRFTVFLPIEGEAKLEIRPSILCIDGDVSILNLLRASFVEVMDMPLETAATPEGVIGYLVEHPEVDIVISGFAMPEKKGWELLKEIKKRFPLLTVILYVAHPDLIREKPDDIPEPDGILVKPFKMNQLVKIINRIGRQTV